MPGVGSEAGMKGVYIVGGEVGAVLAILRRSQRWAPQQPQLLEEQDPLSRGFADLREVLYKVRDLSEMSPSTFLDPFLEVIRSDQTSGPVTGQALASVGKFLSLGLLDPNARSAASAVENLADAVTHARFLATDTASDEVVLLKILQVLRSLLLSPVGALLANESVCEIMQSCFRICFEQRLSELLRKAAESTLADMIQLLFTRLPSFEEDPSHPYIRKLKMRANLYDPNRIRRRKKYKGKAKKPPQPPIQEPPEEEAAKATEETPASEEAPSQAEQTVQLQPAPPPATTQSESETEKPTVLDLHTEHLGFQSEEEPGALSPDCDSVQSPTSPAEAVASPAQASHSPPAEEGAEAETEAAAAAKAAKSVESAESEEEEPRLEAKSRRNERGVRFTVEVDPAEAETKSGGGGHIPYGLPCVRELFRFLISLTSPSDPANTEQMMGMGLSLLTVALEAGADALGHYSLLLPLVKNELARALFLLLSTEKLGLFAAALRVCFLLFEALRGHLKFQLEGYLTRLMAIVVSESPRVGFEQKEMALEALVGLWGIPGLVNELHLNYDCDIYASNLFEDIAKLLSKNAFPVQGLYSTHILSLDALLTVVDSIEGHCHERMLSSGAGEKAAVMRSALRTNRMPVSEEIPSHEDLIAAKKKKKLLTMGSEMFNQSPSKGVGFLQEHGLLQTPLRPEEVVLWLRENPRLDKKKIAEYICSRKNSSILAAFVKSFNFEGVRIDDALRLFLEAFRLPGEAAEISMIIEHFSEAWHSANEAPFANTDAAFTLSYAVIMLNVDQHNTNAKRQQIPMTLNEFCRNLSGVNGGGDFEREMLEDIYAAIKGEEIVMPAEQTGLVKENYEWKVLLKRGAASAFLHAPSGLYDHDLFGIVWGPCIAALSFVFDHSEEGAETILQKAMGGFRKCAAIAAHYGLGDVFDNLVVSLVKFTGLAAETPASLPQSFAGNAKAQMAARLLFELLHRHGDILREGWASVVDLLLQLHKARLLPAALTTVEDYVHPSGSVSILKEAPKLTAVRSESGILYSLVSILGGSEAREGRGPTAEEVEAAKAAASIVADCAPQNIVTDSKYLTSEALGELIKAIVAASELSGEAFLSESEETRLIFYLELLISVGLENRDRLAPFWSRIQGQLRSVLLQAPSGGSGLLVERGVVGVLRLGSRLLLRESMAEEVMEALGLLQLLKPPVLRRLAPQITAGLHQLLRCNAANIHSRPHWHLLFSLLEAAGAGAIRAGGEGGGEAAEEGEDSEEDGDEERRSGGGALAASSHGGSAEWLMVQAEGGDSATAANEQGGGRGAAPAVPLVLRSDLRRHQPKAFLKACESLAFLVRDAAHITPENLDSCVACLRCFVEASLDGGRYARLREAKEPSETAKAKKGKKAMAVRSKSPTGADSPSSGGEDEESLLADSYHQISHQLLDLCHTLHVKAGSLYVGQDGVDGGFLWERAWRPLLQAMARLCCDCRRQLRTTALNYLQRAFLVHDLQSLLGAQHWEDCFTQVLFPLLAALLQNLSPLDPLGMEETRVRTLALLCKVFLQHLSPLASLPTFTALWMTILDFSERYLHTDRSDLLAEAIPESLKNMLLVMDTTRLFLDKPQLYTLTQDRLATFLPQLMDEILPKAPDQAPSSKDDSAKPPREGAAEGAETLPEVPVPDPDPRSAMAGPAPSPPPPEVPLQEVVVHGPHPPVPTPPSLSSSSSLHSQQLPSSSSGLVLLPPTSHPNPPQ